LGCGEIKLGWLAFFVQQAQGYKGLCVPRLGRITSVGKEHVHAMIHENTLCVQEVLAIVVLVLEDDFDFFGIEGLSFFF